MLIIVVISMHPSPITEVAIFISLLPIVERFTAYHTKKDLIMNNVWSVACSSLIENDVNICIPTSITTLLLGKNRNQTAVIGRKWK